MEKFHESMARLPCRAIFYWLLFFTIKIKTMHNLRDPKEGEQAEDQNKAAEETQTASSENAADEGNGTLEE
jgi:hypothetical protein